MRAACVPASASSKVMRETTTGSRWWRHRLVRWRPRSRPATCATPRPSSTARRVPMAWPPRCSSNTGRPVPTVRPSPPRPARSPPADRDRSRPRSRTCRQRPLGISAWSPAAKAAPPSARTKLSPPATPRHSPASRSAAPISPQASRVASTTTLPPCRTTLPASPSPRSPPTRPRRSTSRRPWCRPVRRASRCRSRSAPTRSWCGWTPMAG